MRTCARVRKQKYCSFTIQFKRLIGRSMIIDSFIENLLAIQQPGFLQRWPYESLD
jgi:hypothetical protein